MLLSRMDIKLGAMAAAWAPRAARRPLLLVLCLVALACACAYLGYDRLDFDFRDTRIIARDVPFREDARAAEAQFPWIGGDGVVAVIESDDPVVARETASRLLAAVRDRPSLFSGVFAPGLGPFYEQNGLLLLSPQETEAVATRLQRWMPLIELLSTQPDLVGLATALDQLGIAAQMHIFPPEGTALLTELDRVVQSLMDGRPAVADWQGILVGDLNQNRQRWTISIGLEHQPEALAMLRRLAADPALTASGAARVSVLVSPGAGGLDLGRLTDWAVQALLLALGAVVVIVLLGVRSTELFLACVMASLFSLALIAGAAGLLLGTISLPGLILAIVLIGLSADGPLLAALRYREERLNGRDHDRALANAARSFGPPLLICALVMVVAFAAFWITDLAGIARLAMFAAVAMVIAWLVTMAAMPALLTLLPIAPRRPAPAVHTVLQAVGAALTAQPVRLAITLPIMIAAITALLLLPQVQFDRDLDYGASLPPQAAAHAVAKSLDEAQTLVARLEALPEVAGVTSVLSYIPGEQGTKLALLRGIQATLDQVGQEPEGSQIIAAGLQHGAEANALDQFTEAISGIARADVPPAARAAAQTLDGTMEKFIARAGDKTAAAAALDAALVGSLRETTAKIRTLAEASRISLDTLDPDLKRRYVSPAGDYLVEVKATGDLRQTDQLHRFANAVRAVAPGASGPAIDAVETGHFLKLSTLRVLAVAAAGIALLLLLLLPKAYDVFLVSVPIGLAGLILSGATVVMDLKIVPMALLALPVLIGIGVGNCVKMIMRARESIRFSGMSRPSTPRAVLWSMLATIAAAGVLLMSPVPMLVAVGQFLLIGVALLLVCIFLVLPTLVQLTQPRYRK
ncbi:MMPL family transporter [Rhodoligotrophos defluvii]|uniref:MMPL family transporter n=1 Tax=Rhodoligotrophos defluvii TaxID=2561934 RepID=UPI0010CA1DCF|nr:MMPL family transporter [Rhodoligotrophos defluvii]